MKSATLNQRHADHRPGKRRARHSVQRSRPRASVPFAPTGASRTDDQAPGSSAGIPSWLPTASLIANQVRGHWQLVLVMVVFFGSMFVIPVMSDAPSTDDWAYSRSVEILVHEGRLHILDLTVVTLLFQLAWGTIFSFIFGVGFGAMRLSTVVLVGLSIPAMYGICRILGVRRSLSAIGAALYAFNPLTFSLAFTFMSDGQFTALLVISGYLYLRGLIGLAMSARLIFLGSVIAACAFLVRQQGLLIPAAVGAYLVLSRHMQFRRKDLRLAISIAGIPLLTAVIYVMWLVFMIETPEQQGAFVEQITSAGWADTRLLASRLTYIEVVYIGASVVPVALALFPALPRWRPARWWPATVTLAAWSLVILFGATTFFDQGRVMPYIQQFVGAHGVGPLDLWGGRHSLVSRNWLVAITWLCLASAAIFGMFTSSAMAAPSSRERSAASLLTAVGLFQAAGVLPPSFHFRDWIISVDRYLLPIIPLAIALFLWAVREAPINTVRLWVLTGLLAVFSIVAVRDCLVFQDATWTSARRAISYGVPLTMLDAGASWDGYHLYEFSLANGIQPQTPGGPWWTNLFAPATTSTYIISSVPREGFTIVEQREYSSWMNPGPVYLYLLRQNAYPGPP